MKAACTRGLMLATLVALSAGACGDGTGPSGFPTDELTAELAITPSHLHAYQTTVTFTVAVTDPDGNPVTDFDVVQVERRAVGGATWSVSEAALDADFYVVDLRDGLDALPDARTPSESGSETLFEVRTDDGSDATDACQFTTTGPAEVLSRGATRPRAQP